MDTHPIVISIEQLLQSPEKLNHNITDNILQLTLADDLYLSTTLIFFFISSSVTFYCAISSIPEFVQCRSQQYSEIQQHFRITLCTSLFTILIEHSPIHTHLTLIINSIQILRS